MHLFEPESIDFLIIGHVSEDLQANGGIALGGTVSYSGLTALALGNNVAILTSCPKSTPLDALGSIPIERIPSEKASQFRNIPTENGRVQYLYSQAKPLLPENIPGKWKEPAMVHIAPIFNDVAPQMLAQFPKSLVCLTPQGWMRDLDSQNRVISKTLAGLEKWLIYAHIIVLSEEDLQHDPAEALRLSQLTKILVVTQGDNGASVYHQGERRHFPAPKLSLVDDTGSGDIFATCFFHHYHRHKNPWQAAEFAVQLASQSITRMHLNSIPTPEEIEIAKETALEKVAHD